MSALALGIGLGLAAAVGQSLSYLQTRHLVARAQDGRLQLLVLAHLIQGLACLLLLPLLWPRDIPDWRQYAWPLVFESLGYLAGQACLFSALRHAEASRIAPLLAVKIVILAGLSWLVLGRQIAPLQWLAVALAVGSAWVLNWTGGRTPPRTVLLALTACLGYAISDLYIRVTIECMAPVAPLHAALVACALSYVFCGLLVLPLGLRLHRAAWRDAAKSAPYALTWLASMGFLYGCFGLAGVVLGNIVQSTRGLISVLLAPWLARHTHWSHLEPVQTPHATARRIGCALCMSAAVALYILGG